MSERADRPRRSPPTRPNLAWIDVSQAVANAV
jgi:hypothetical protein